MKKIALLTIHHTTNFGSALQTYSLYQKVKELGYDIEILDYRCKAIEEREFFKPNILDLKSLYRKVLYGRKIREKSVEFDKFIRGYSKLSKVYTAENVQSANDSYDTFLVGSDIVWGLNVTGNDYNYFLKFVNDDKRKVAFASSAGLKWSDENREEITGLLNRFDSIGVRESLVADWIQEFTGKRPNEVVDPTMLWKAEYWENHAKKSDLKLKKYILVYFCDKDEKILADARKLGKRKGLEVIYINYGKKQKGIKSVKPTKIEDFLYLVKNAEYVLSASFHGLLYSLYFNKEVYFYNRANFSRMESLASWLGIEDHNGMVYEIEDSKHIDYAKVNELVEEKRKESIDILKEYLG